jgi:hypothetical protein
MYCATCCKVHVTTLAVTLNTASNDWTGYFTDSNIFYVIKQFVMCLLVKRNAAKQTVILPVHNGTLHIPELSNDISRTDLKYKRYTSLSMARMHSLRIYAGSHRWD